MAFRGGVPAEDPDVEAREDAALKELARRRSWIKGLWIGLTTLAGLAAAVGVGAQLDLFRESVRGIRIELPQVLLLGVLPLAGAFLGRFLGRWRARARGPALVAELAGKHGVPAARLAEIGAMLDASEGGAIGALGKVTRTPDDPLVRNDAAVATRGELSKLERQVIRAARQAERAEARAAAATTDDATATAAETPSAKADAEDEARRRAAAAAAGQRQR